MKILILIKTIPLNLMKNTSPGWERFRKNKLLKEKINKLKVFLKEII